MATKWKAKYQKKWYQVKHVQDTGIPAHEEGGGNVYHLEGVEKPVHQSKIEDLSIEKVEDMDKKEKIVGGFADNKTVEDIAKRHNVSIASIEKQLNIGIKIEKEHTSDSSKAREISMDHLWEIPDYYDRLDNMENKADKDGKLSETKKYDRVEVAPDGKTELDYGKEDLNKPGLRTRWESIKKSLDNESAIMNLSEQEGDDTEEQPDSDQQDQGQDNTDEQSEVTQDQGQDNTDEQSDTASQSVDDQGFSGHDEEQKIIEALKDEGYSPTEIAYIMHGQSMPDPTLDDEKINAVKQKSDIDSQGAKHKIDMANKVGEIDLSHKKRLSDAEHEHKQKMYDIERKKAEADLGAIDPASERAHRQRMLDLEYEQKKKEVDANEKGTELEHKKALQALEIEKAKAEIALELEFKKMEMKLKLEEKKLLAEQNKDHKSQVNEIKHAQAIKDAKTTTKEVDKPSKKK